MYKQIYFLYAFILFFSLLSCERNPLRDISGDLREGYLKGGADNIPLFDMALHKNLVKVSIDGKNKSVLRFTENKKSTHNISVNMLYNLDSQYNIDAFFKNQGRIMEGSVWTFSALKNKGALTWKPSKIFTGKDLEKRVSLFLVIEFRNKDSSSKESAPLFVLEKELSAIVHKSFDPPEIYKVVSKYNEYEKLSDGYFYTRHGAEYLNLNYYDKVFAGWDRRKEAVNHLKFYAQSFYDRFSVESSAYSSKYGDYPEIDEGRKAFDKFVLILSVDNEKIPERLLRYLQKPIYHEVHERTTAQKCKKSESVFVGDKRWCLALLGSMDSDRSEETAQAKDEEDEFQKENEEALYIPFEKNIYLKHYIIPKNIDPERLFYKVSSFYLCEVYQYISSDYFIDSKKKEWSGDSECYLSALKSSFFKEKNLIEESGEDIYFLKEDDQLELVNVSDWKFAFTKVPDFIKWELGGHRKVESANRSVFRINVGSKKNLVDDSNLRNQTKFFEFSLYIRDYNYFEFSPTLVPVTEKNETVFWMDSNSVNLYDWRIESVHRISQTAWKIDYIIKPQFSNQFQSFEFHLAPFSQYLSHDSGDSNKYLEGKRETIYINTFPYMTVTYNDIFKDDIEFEREFIENRWNFSRFAISDKLKIQYIFNISRLLEAIYKYLPFRFIPFSLDFNNQEKLNFEETFLKYVEANPIETHTNFFECSDVASGRQMLAKEKEWVDLNIKMNACHCSDYHLQFEEQEPEIYDDDYYSMSASCSYSAEFQLQASDKYLSILRKETPSFYWLYRYTFNLGSFGIKNGAKNNRREKALSEVVDIPLKHDLSKSSSLRYTEVENKNEVERLRHIFFNLKPDLNSIQCVFLKDQDILKKECKIIYPVEILQEIENQSVSQFPSLGKKVNLKARFQCEDWPLEQQKNNCSCDDEVTFLGDRSGEKGTGLSVSCSFHQDQKGQVSFYLETDGEEKEGHQVYILRPDADDGLYRRTSTEILDLDSL